MRIQLFLVVPELENVFVEFGNSRICIEIIFYHIKKEEYIQKEETHQNGQSKKQWHKPNRRHKKRF